MRRLHFVTLTLLALGGGCQSPPSEAALVGDLRVEDGARLHYRVVGRGADTVIVLHGGPGLSSSYLYDAFDGLATRHTVIYYDQRGRGRSDPPPDSLHLSATQDVADLEAVRTFFHLNRFAVIGHGWGAGLAALYAMGHPGQVARLLLISPMFPRGEYLWDLTMRRADGRDTTGLDGLMAAREAGLDTADPVAFCRRYWGALLSPTPVYDRAVLRRLSTSVCDAPSDALRRVELVNRRVTGSLGGWDWRAGLAAVSAPVLVVQAPGAETWLAAAREWVESLPDAKLLVVGSVPQFPWLHAGRQFSAPVQQFLSGTWPPRATAP